MWPYLEWQPEGEPHHVQLGRFVIKYGTCDTLLYMIYGRI